MGVRHLLINTVLSRWMVRLASGTTFDFGPFLGQVNNQGDLGFIELTGGIADPVSGIAPVALTKASDYLYVGVTTDVIFCLQLQTSPLTTASIDCDGGSDLSTTFVIDHHIGEVPAGISSAECIDAQGRVEGSHKLCAEGRVDQMCRKNVDCDTFFQASDGICGLDPATCTAPAANVGIGCQADGDCDTTEETTDGVCGAPGSHSGVCNGPLTQPATGANSGAGALRFQEPGLRASLKVEQALPCGDEGEGLTTFLPFTSAHAGATILHVDNKQGSNFAYDTQGENFSCLNWDSPSAPGCLALVIPALDQFTGGIDTITELHLCGQ